MWGHSIDALTRHYERTGEMPPALAEMPVLSPDISFYLNAFSYLGNFRSYSEAGPSVISFIDICKYADILGYKDPNSLLFFAKVINGCDLVFIEDANKKRAAKLAAAKSKNSAKR